MDLGALDRDGYVIVPQVLGADEARAAADRAFALAADLATLGPQDKVHGGTIHLDLRHRDEVVERLATHPLVRTAVDHLLGPDRTLAQAAFRCPRPGHGEQQLHADAPPLERVGPVEGVTTILALADFTADNGATTIVPGSHLRPDQQRAHVRPLLVDREVALTGPIGTAFVFSAHLLHRGSRNRSTRPRPAIQAVWRPGRSEPPS